MKHILPPASAVNFICHIKIQDTSSTTGAGKTGLLYNTSGLIGYYMRAGDTQSRAMTLVDITTLGTFAPASDSQCGFKEVDSVNMPGLYEIHVANNALKTGANQVTIMFSGASGMAQTTLEIQLRNVNTDVLTIEGSDATDQINAAVDAALDTAIPGSPTSGSINKLVKDNLDAPISVVDTVADGIKTKTDGLNFSGNDILATLDGETVTVGTNNDKSNYTLHSDYNAAKTAASQSSVNTVDTVVDGIKTQTDKISFNGFNDVIASLDGEAVTVGTNNDKTDYALTSDYNAAKTAASQNSVTTIDGKVTTVDDIVDDIKAQTEKLHFNIDGDVLATLNNETVTVLSNLDKAGYSLSVTPPTAIEIRTELDSNSVKLASIVAKTNTLDWTDIEFLLDYIGGRRRIVQNQMIIYKSDNITEVCRFDLKDFQGLPTMENVFERVRV